MEVFMVRSRCLGYLSWIDGEAKTCGFDPQVGQACLCHSRHEAQQLIERLRGAGFQGGLNVVRAELTDLFDEV